MYFLPADSVDKDKVHFCERFLELLVDLEVNFDNISTKPTLKSSLSTCQK